MHDRIDTKFLHEQMSKEDQLGINDRIHLADGLAAEGLELAIATMLRTFVAEHLAHVPQLHRLRLIDHTVLDIRTHHGSRALRAQRHHLIAGGLKTVHLLLHDVGRFAHAAREQGCLFQDRRVDALKTVGIGQTARGHAHLFPHRLFAGQDVLHAAHQIDRLRGFFVGRCGRAGFADDWGLGCSRLGRGGFLHGHRHLVIGRRFEDLPPIERPTAQPDLADQEAAFDRAKVARVETGHAIVAEDEVLVALERDRTRGRGIGLIKVRLLQDFAVRILVVIDLDLTAGDLDRLSRQADDALDEELRRIVRIAEDHDVAAARIAEAITDLVDDQIFMIIEARLHRCALHIERLDEEVADRDDDGERDRDHLDQFEEQAQGCFFRFWFRAFVPRERKRHGDSVAQPSGLVEPPSHSRIAFSQRSIVPQSYQAPFSSQPYS